MWRDEKLVEEQPVSLNANGLAEHVFQVTEPSEGLYRYEVRLSPVAGEATVANNRATLLLRSVEEPVRMLLLEGKPYWDTKFLLRSLSRDPSVELTAVVRLTEDRLLQRKVPGIDVAPGSVSVIGPGGPGDPGGPGEVVTIRIDYDIELVTPFIRPLFRNGVHHYSVSVVSQNEPFRSGA